MLESLKQNDSFRLALAVISSGVLTSLLTAFFTYRAATEQLESDKFIKLIDTYIEENTSLKTENRRIVELEQEVYKLRTQVQVLESATQNLPIAMWTKDVDFVMLAVNAVYEYEFLFPRGLSAEDYVGRTDYEIWDLNTANRFRTNDIWVKKNKKPLKVIEKIPDINGDIHRYLIIKYPRYVGGVYVGQGGLALKLEEFEDSL